jgi:lysophospholipase L1-like esterase
MKKIIRLITVLFIIGSAASANAHERWLFLGDSITYGGDYVDYIETWSLLNEPDAPEIIDLGVSSETVSGLSEPAHPFPRPYLHHRLTNVLDRINPDVVFACYGMNCAIYHPFSDERFKAYQDGINRLVSEVQSRGAKIILLTPPPYAGSVKPKPLPGPGEEFSFMKPTPDYNDVLARYADWILSLDGQNGIRAFSVRPGLERFMKDSYKREPIHPTPYGHEILAESLLQGLGKETGSDILQTGVSPHKNDSEWNALYALVQQERIIYERALLCEIGHENPGVMKRQKIPLTEAIKQVEPIRQQIKALTEAHKNHE